MQVKLLTSTQCIYLMETFAAIAALTCHANKEGKYVPAKVLKRIIKAGHESVLEHINLTFSIEGLSRACLQELSRHRHISMSVQSTRHTLRKQTLRTDEVEYACDIDEFKLELAAMVAEFIREHPDMPNDELKYYIPEFWPTNLIITLNVREFRHILDLRTAPDALKEFRILARSMFNEVPDEFKYLLEDCIHEEVANGETE